MTEILQDLYKEKEDCWGQSSFGVGTGNSHQIVRGFIKEIRYGERKSTI